MVRRLTCPNTLPPGEVLGRCFTLGHEYSATSCRAAASMSPVLTLDVWSGGRGGERGRVNSPSRGGCVKGEMLRVSSTGQTGQTRLLQVHAQPPTVLSKCHGLALSAARSIFTLLPQSCTVLFQAHLTVPCHRCASKTRGCWSVGG